MDETASLLPTSHLLVSHLPADTAAALGRDLSSLQHLPESERLDALLLDQRSRWQNGDRIAVEVYRQACPGLTDDTETLLHLITSEALLRRQLGEHLDYTEYLDRFPQHADSLQRQFQVESAMDTVAHSDLTGSSRATVDLPSDFTSPPQIGGTGVPGFEILSELGRGGMGVVYKARQLGLNRLVALKMILAGAGARENVRDRFRREAEAVAQLKHPNIVPIYAIGEHARQLYFALEYIPGGSLASQLDGKPWAPRRAAAMVATLAGAVQHAHEKGFIHRDLKPANVLIDEAGVPHITDFGLARQVVGTGMTIEGAVLGTPAYMAPEQAAGLSETIGAVSDVFGLGAILYQLLTGRPPYQGPDLHTTLRQAEQGKVLPVRELNPAVPATLARICDRALAPDPKQRYASAAVLEQDLRRYLTWARRLVLPAAIGAALLLLVAGVGITLSLPRNSDNHARNGISPSPVDPNPPAPPPPAPALAPLDGELNVRVWSEKDGKRGWKVQEPGALPVRSGEMVHLEVKLTRKAHVYLVWVDGQGSVDPLYPWPREEGALNKPPPVMTPTAEVHSPEPRNQGWPVDGESGLETALLLARETPLPENINLAKLLDRIPPSPLRELHEVAVRGYNREMDIKPVDIKRGVAKQAKEIDDPLLEMMERVRKHFDVVRAVRFAHQK